jgi:hypothetical protein
VILSQWEEGTVTTRATTGSTAAHASVRDEGLSRLTKLTVGAGLAAALGSGVVAVAVSGSSASATPVSDTTSTSGVTTANGGGLSQQDNPALQAPQAPPGYQAQPQMPSGFSGGS